MKSTKTRLAASVLALSIPLVPSAAHADAKSPESSSYTQPGSSQDSSASADSLDALLDQAPRSIDRSTRDAIIDALASADSATEQALEVRVSRFNPTAFSAHFDRERTGLAQIAIDAALAELRHTRAQLPADAEKLLVFLGAAISDLETFQAE